MSFYKKRILPYLIDLSMRGENLEKLRSRVIKNASGTVLEIGFGSGLNLPFYKNIEKLYALEPNDKLYDIGKHKIKYAHFPIQHLNSEAEKIPLENDSIDTIVSTWTLCSVSNQEKVLKEIRRVLKKDGRFIFIEHGKSENGIIQSLQNILTPCSKCISGGCRLNLDIENLISNAGFEIKNLKKFEEKSKPLGFMYEGIAVKKAP